VNVVINGKSRCVREHVTVAALLEELGMTARPIAVEVNREVVPRDTHTSWTLHEGDQLEVVTLVGGG
jgi:sulfur carrier protein